MLNQVARLDPTGVSRKAKSVLRQKTYNVAYLRQIILAARTSTSDALPLTLLSFAKAAQTLAANDRFTKDLLPALLDGRVDPWEELAPTPSVEIREWAATRFAPETRYLEILNAQTWQHFLIATFSMPASPYGTFLTPDQISACQQAYDQLRAERPALSDRLLTERPSQLEVRAAFRLLLGREPHKTDDIAEISRKGYPNLFRSLLSSLEFQRTFDAWLAGQTLPHKTGKGRSAYDCETKLIPLLSDEFTTETFEEKTWEESFSSLWLTPQYESRLLSFLASPSPLNDFVSQLIKNAVRKLQSDKSTVLVACVREGATLKCYIASQDSTSGGPPTLEIRDSAGAVLHTFELQKLAAGRQLLQLQIPHAIHNATVSEPTTCHLCEGSTEVDETSLLLRPPIGKHDELVAKFNWRLEQANFGEAANLLQNIQLTEDDVTTLALSTHLANLSDSTDAEDIRQILPPDWIKFLELARNRRLSTSSDDPLPKQVADTLGRKTAFTPAAEYAAGIIAATSSPVSRALTAVSGTSPDNSFLASLDDIKSSEQAFELLANLSIIDAPDPFLVAATERLSQLSPRYYEIAKSSTAGRISTGAILRASAYLPPKISTQIAGGKAAIKYAETLGRYSAAVDIARELAKTPPKQNNTEQLLLASVIINKYGEKTEAADLLKTISDLNPNRMDLLARYLRSERGEIMQDPLRWTPEYQKKVERFRRSKVIALVEKPETPTLREELAEALVIEGRETEAQSILLSLYELNDISENGKKRLIDICVKNNSNDLALKICESLPEEELSEWVVINHARALRALGRAEDAGALLDAYATGDMRNVSREAIRNRFFLADFENARDMGEAACENLPEDIELRLITAAAHLELGELEASATHIDAASGLANAERFAEELSLFRYSIAKKRSDKMAISALDNMFYSMGCHSVRTKQGSMGGFDDFKLGSAPANLTNTQHPPVQSGPLVSVIMTSYNSSAYINTAIRSILQQTYSNIELIVVDDCSTDDTPEILRTWEARDPRVQAVLRTENSGTYVSKNLGLLRARGEFVALQDSDDWSHPDRIAKSVSVLQDRPDIMGITTDWLRMTNEGDLMVKAGGQISHVCCISLVFRREPVVDKIGFFDSVRIEADMEYIRRIRLAFGGRSVARLRWPLLFGRIRSDSLTGNEEFGISRTGFSQPRLDYQAAQAQWHHAVRHGANPFMPFPLVDRRFEAPDIILPNREVEPA